MQKRVVDRDLLCRVLRLLEDLYERDNYSWASSDQSTIEELKLLDLDGLSAEEKRKEKELRKIKYKRGQKFM
jgi:hypothetical protein